MTDNLTARQRDVFEFICEFMRTRGMKPTIREISQHFGIRSPNGVVCHIKALEKKGFIDRRPRVARSCTPVGVPICPCCGGYLDDVADVVA